MVTGKFYWWSKLEYPEKITALPSLITLPLAAAKLINLSVDRYQPNR